MFGYKSLAVEELEHFNSEANRRSIQQATALNELKQSILHKKNLQAGFTPPISESEDKTHRTGDDRRSAQCKWSY
jgi:hypothetical protein